MVPKSGGVDSKVFVSESFDPTTHFETAVTDVMAMYKRITGAELQLTDGPKQ
jgi:Rab GDP dissociation inhibitor